MTLPDMSSKLSTSGNGDRREPEIRSSLPTPQQIIERNKYKNQDRKLAKNFTQHMCDGFAMIFLFVRHVLTVFPIVIFL